MVLRRIDVAILGGGARRELCAAITAAEALGANKRVVIFEKHWRAAGLSWQQEAGAATSQCRFELENFLIKSLFRLCRGTRDTFLTDILAFFRFSGRGQLKTVEDVPAYQASKLHPVTVAQTCPKAECQFALGWK